MPEVVPASGHVRNFKVCGHVNMVSRFTEQLVHTVIAQDAIKNQPRKKVRRAVMEQQRCLRNLCLDYTGGLKTMEQFFRDIAFAYHHMTRLVGTDSSHVSVWIFH